MAQRTEKETRMDINGLRIEVVHITCDEHRRRIDVIHIDSDQASYSVAFSFCHMGVLHATRNGTGAHHPRSVRAQSADIMLSPFTR